MREESRTCTKKDKTTRTVARTDTQWSSRWLRVHGVSLLSQSLYSKMSQHVKERTHSGIPQVSVQVKLDWVFSHKQQNAGNSSSVERRQNRYQSNKLLCALLTCFLHLFVERKSIRFWSGQSHGKPFSRHRPNCMQRPFCLTYFMNQWFSWANVVNQLNIFGIIPSHSDFSKVSLHLDVAMFSVARRRNMTFGLVPWLLTSFLS